MSTTHRPADAPPVATLRRSNAHDARLAPSRKQLLGAGLLLSGLWALALASLAEVFTWGPWFERALLIAVVSVGAACVVRVMWPRLRASAALIGVVAGLACWAWWFTGTSRPVTWWREPLTMLDEIRRQVVDGAAPLTVGGPLEDVLLLVIALFVTVTVLVLVGLWHPVLAGALTALILLIPSAVTGATVGWPALVGAGVLLALLVWIASPIPNRVGGVAAILAVAVAASVMAIAPATRDRVWNDAFMSAPVSDAVPDVTIALAEDLRERSNTEAFRFTSTQAGPHRFTLATLSDFTDGRWKPQDVLNADELTVATPRSPATTPPIPLADPAESLTTSTVEVTIEGLLSSWLPLPQSAVQVSGEGAGFDVDQWRWTAAANTARADANITRRGHHYRVDAQGLLAHTLPADRFAEPQPLFADPGAAPEALAASLELAEPVPEALGDAAASVAGDARDRLAVAEALQGWFRSGEFTYDESAPYQPGMNPDDSYAVMEALLTEKRGFCVHYASTFAVMARHLGAPARVAVGYAADASRDDDTVVRGRELHAWPEIYFDDLGWVAFEPTPGGAGLRADTDEDVPAVPEEVSEEEAAAPTPPPGPTPPPNENADDDEPQHEIAADEETSTTLARSIAAWVGVTALVLLLLAPAAIRRIRVLRRRRAMTRRDHAAANAWAEVADTVVDLGLLHASAERVPGAHTHAVPTRAEPAQGGSMPGPRAHTAEALVEYLDARGYLTDKARDAARNLADAMVAERYAGGIDLAPDIAMAISTASSPGTELDRQLDAVLDQLRAGARRLARIRAVWWPRSVFSRNERFGRVSASRARRE